MISTKHRSGKEEAGTIQVGIGRLTIEDVERVAREGQRLAPLVRSGSLVCAAREAPSC
jgi:hypothetical protein